MLFNGLWTKIAQSVVDHLGKVSQVRIQSYFILLEILITGLFFLCIEAANAYLSIWVKGEPYSPTTESIWIFGMVLAHHLVMLGLKKGAESTPFPSFDKKEANKIKQNKNNQYNNEEDPTLEDLEVEDLDLPDDDSDIPPAKNLRDL
jgi:hypothetical protein